MTPPLSSFYAMGTDWWIHVDAPAPLSSADLEGEVRRIEARLSRFDERSALSRLNRHRQVDDPLLAEVVSTALEMRRATCGAFDPAVGQQVIGMGYDQPFDDMPAQSVRACTPSRERPTVLVDGDRVVLLGGGRLDLGGIAKGYTVEHLAGLLQGATGFLIDGGGDLRVGGTARAAWALGIGDELAIDLFDGSVATSSRVRRRWLTPTGEAHHIIDPAIGLPSDAEVLAATVVAGDATTADAVATAIVANPWRALPAAEALGVGVAVQRMDGSWRLNRTLLGRVRRTKEAAWSS